MGALAVLLALAAAGCSGPASSAPSAPAASTAAPPPAAPPAPAPATSASGTAGTAPDWPMYHGAPAHDGVSQAIPDVTGSLKVDKSLKLDVLWHASGQIAGSPVVGGGRVWALDQSGGVLHALDPATGQTLQQARVGETSRFATPAIYGSLVLVPTLAGVAYVQTS